MVVVLTVSLLGAELRGLFCHGRRIPGSEVAIMAYDNVESPPPPPPREAQGHHSSSSSSSEHCRKKPRWRRVQDLSESKRTVPQGPNPLHN
jgi:hypothetical protein